MRVEYSSTSPDTAVKHFTSSRTLHWQVCRATTEPDTIAHFSILLQYCTCGAPFSIILVPIDLVNSEAVEEVIPVTGCNEGLGRTSS